MVDVVIATYNHERYIRKAVDSVLSQRTNFPFKIIIGDDCSDDNTADILKKYKRDFPSRIQLTLHKERIGMELGIKRNGVRLLESCSSEYVALLDGDDYWINPMKLQKQFDTLEQRKDIDLCAHRTKIVSSRARPIEIGLRPHNSYIGRDLCQEDIVKMITGMGPSVHTSSLFFRKSILGETEILSKIAVADYYILIQATMHGKVLVLDEVMSAYRKNPSGISKINSLNLARKFNNMIAFYGSMNAATQGRFGRYFKPKLIRGWKGLMKVDASEGRIIKATISFVQLLRLSIFQIFAFKDLVKYTLLYLKIDSTQFDFHQRQK